jgi:uncharacterized protein (TIGR03118 family)
MLRKIRHLSFTRVRSAALCLLAASLSFSAVAAGQDTSQQYTQTNLVSNLAGMASNVDTNLVNPWGLARSSGSPWWVADNGTGLSTLYDGTGAAKPLVVTIPPSDPTAKNGAPTGAVFNGNKNAFFLKPKMPAIFIFVTEDGTISGWNPGVQPTSAVIMVNNKTASVFKGATIANATIKGQGAGIFLYVADFRQGVVQIYNSGFTNVGSFGKTFAAGDPENNGRWAPFNVQNIGGDLYVSYALQDAAKHDDVPGPNLGFVKVFSPSGFFLRQLPRGDFFNAPWGLVMAPSDFGAFTHNILVGQFGSGEILAFDAGTGKFRGKLLNDKGNTLVIDGLWALSPGGGALTSTGGSTSGSATSIFFSAGINGEKDGLFGSLTAVSNPQGNHQ